MNIILNQLLISSHTTISVFGMLLSIPGAGLGVRGAAIATAISQGIGGVTIFGLQCKSIGDTKRNEGETGRKIVKKLF